MDRTDWFVVGCFVLFAAIVLFRVVIDIIVPLFTSRKG